MKQRDGGRGDGTGSRVVRCAVALLVVSAVLSACGEEAQQAYSDAKHDVGQALDEARTGVGEAVVEAGEAWDAAKGDLSEAGAELSAAWGEARGELGEAMTAAFAMFSATSKDAKASLGQVVGKLEELKAQGGKLSAVPGALLASPEWKQLVADAGEAWDRLGLSLQGLANDPQLATALHEFMQKAKSALKD